jgi:hypothetical protein
MSLTGEGRVGIGTTAPAAKLDVQAGITNEPVASFNAASGMYIALDEGASHRGYIGSYAGSSSDVDFGTRVGNNSGSVHLTINASPKLTVRPNGQVGIGTTTPAAGYQLSVAGKIMCEEMRVQLQGNWPDYVFDEGYRLMPLNEVAAYIEAHGHLPGIPSAGEVGEAQGIEVGAMQARLLEKMEEQYLYLIQLQADVEKLQTENEMLKAQLTAGE